MITTISFRWAFEKLIIITREVMTGGFMIEGFFFFVSKVLASSSKIALIIKSISVDVWSKEIEVIVGEICDVFSMKNESS